MTYEGWANYHTWNVALWINNDQPLYEDALRYLHTAYEPTYEGFIEQMSGEYGDITPDGVSWTDPTLDHDELNTFIKGLGE